MRPNNGNRQPRSTEQEAPPAMEVLKLEPSTLKEVQAAMVGVVTAKEKQIAELEKQSTEFSPRVRYELEQAAERKSLGLRKVLTGHESAAKIAVGDFSKDDWAQVAAAFVTQNSYKGALEDLDHIKEFEYNGVRFKGAALEQLKRTSQGISARAQIAARTQRRYTDPITGEEKVEGGVAISSIQDIADRSLGSKRGAKLQEAIDALDEIDLPFSLQKHIGEAFESRYSPDQAEMDATAGLLKKDIRSFYRKDADGKYTQAQLLAIKTAEDFIDKTQWELRVGAEHLHRTVPDLMMELAAAYRSSASPEAYEERKYSIVNLYMAKTFNLNVGQEGNIQNPRVTRKMIEAAIAENQNAWFRARSGQVFNEIAVTTRNVPPAEIPQRVQEVYERSIEMAKMDGILVNELQYDADDPASKKEAELTWIASNLERDYPAHVTADIERNVDNIMLQFRHEHGNNATLEQNISMLLRYYRERYGVAPGDAFVMGLLNRESNRFHLELALQDNPALFTALQRRTRSQQHREALFPAIEIVYEAAFNGEYAELVRPSDDFARFAGEYFMTQSATQSTESAQRAYRNVAETYRQYSVYLEEQRQQQVQQPQQPRHSRSRSAQPRAQQSVSSIAP